MSPIFIGLISFVCVLAGALSGFFLGRLLPEHHLSHDSKESIKMAWGILATMSALVLGLLVASAKESFDDMENANIQAASNIIALHHILARYGPDANGVRDELRNAVVSTLKSDWQEDDLSGDDDGPVQRKNGLERVKDKLNDLKPTTDAQRARLAEAEQICGDLSQARWLLIERTRTALPPVLLTVLVFWLALLFMGMAVFAPHNKTVLTALILCSFSVSVSIFVINDLSHPLKGLITISSHPMHDALDHLQNN